MDPEVIRQPRSLARIPINPRVGTPNFAPGLGSRLDGPSENPMQQRAIPRVVAQREYEPAGIRCPHMEREHGIRLQFIERIVPHQEITHPYQP